MDVNFDKLTLFLMTVWDYFATSLLLSSNEVQILLYLT